MQTAIALIETLYAAFGRADIAAIVEHLTDDVVWHSHCEPGVPWAGDFSGKDRVPAFFEGIYGSVEVEAFTPLEWFEAGDAVVSVGEFACRVRSTGKPAATRWVFLFRLRDGKVCSYEQFQSMGLGSAFRQG